MDELVYLLASDSSLTAAKFLKRKSMIEEKNINIGFAVTSIKVHISFPGLAWCPPQHVAPTTVYLYASLH